MTNIGHLLRDFVLEVPGQYEDVIGLGFSNSIRVINRYVGPGQKEPLLVRAAVNRVVDKINADPAVVKRKTNEMKMGYARERSLNDKTRSQIKKDIP